MSDELDLYMRLKYSKEHIDEGKKIAEYLVKISEQKIKELESPLVRFVMRQSVEYMAAVAAVYVLMGLHEGRLKLKKVRNDV